MNKDSPPSIAAIRTVSREAFCKPALKPFRRLQFIALGLAVLWLVVVIIGGKEWINQYIQSEVDLHKAKAQSQGQFLEQLIDKELRTADQLAVALSHEANILTHMKTMNRYADHMSAMDTATRKAFIETHPNTQQVNEYISRLLLDVDLMSVFLLDSSGNCIATGYIFLADVQKDVGCLGNNYLSRYYFIEARQEGHGHQFAVGKAVPLPSVFFARASTDQDQFIGATVVRVNTENLLQNQVDLRAVSWVADSNGMVISSTRQKDLLKYINNGSYPQPSKELLRRVYKKNEETQVSWSVSRSHPPSWGVWLLDGEPAVFTRMDIGEHEFDLWHSVVISNSLEALEYRGWLFVSSIAALGVLFIFVTERITDFHQRRLAHIQALARAHQSLEQASHELYVIAITDHLTQLSSRAYFFQRLEEEITRAYRERKPLTVLLLDIDHFKKVNDAYGHPAGDAAICLMAEYCRKATRSADLIGRIGGEEFAISLIECSEEAALSIAEEIRESCEKGYLLYEGNAIRFTCSIGLAVLSENQTADYLVRRADRALYVAKNEGRNCVRCAE